MMFAGILNGSAFRFFSCFNLQKCYGFTVYIQRLDTLSNDLNGMNLFNPDTLELSRRSQADLDKNHNNSIL